MSILMSNHSFQDLSGYKPPSGSTMSSTTILTYDPNEIKITLNNPAIIQNGLLNGESLQANCDVKALGGEALEEKFQDVVDFRLRWEFARDDELTSKTLPSSSLSSTSTSNINYKTISITHSIEKTDNQRRLSCILSVNGVDVGNSTTKAILVKYPPQTVISNVLYERGKQVVRCEADDHSPQEDVRWTATVKTLVLGSGDECWLCCCWRCCCWRCC